MRDEPQGGELVPRPAGHLFGQNVARIAFKRGAYLRNFVYAFAEMLVRPAQPLAGRRAPWPAIRRTTSYERTPRSVSRRRDRRRVESRLPQVGTTIFTVMSALAQQHGAVNLGQGFPDFDCDPRLLDAVDAAMRGGLNQYPPMAGVPALRERGRREDRGAVRPPLRPGDRDHRHRRRDPGDPHRHPGARAPGRRGDRARPVLRQLRAEHRARRRRRRCTCR